MDQMEEVEGEAVPLELLAGILAPDRAEHMFEAAARAPDRHRHLRNAICLAHF